VLLSLHNEEEMKETVSVRLWREGVFTCHLSTKGHPHLRVSANRELVLAEPVTTWMEACERALTLQEIARRTLVRMEAQPSC
jgi:hypothetical protein